jgi:hypothetical protein
MGDLWFAEEPYKVYTVKVTGMPTIKAIPFEEISNGKKVKIYKGEGSVTFTAYWPYAHTPDYACGYYELREGYTWDICEPVSLNKENTIHIGLSGDKKPATGTVILYAKDIDNNNELTFTIDTNHDNNCLTITDSNSDVIESMIESSSANYEDFVLTFTFREEV